MKALMNSLVLIRFFFGGIQLEFSSSSFARRPKQIFEFIKILGVQKTDPGSHRSGLGIERALQLIHTGPAEHLYLKLSVGRKQIVHRPVACNGGKFGAIVLVAKAAIPCYPYAAVEE